MAGFFGELIDCTPVQRELDVLREQLVQKSKQIKERKDPVFRCADCTQRSGCGSSISSPIARGKGRKKILLIGQDLPDAYLTKQLAKLRIDLFEDCWILTPVLYDHAHYNNKVTDAEVGKCSARILQWIKLHKPEKIFLFGTPALKSVLGHRVTGRVGLAIEAWAGWKIPDQKLKTWVFPMYGIYAVTSAGKKFAALPKLFNEHLRTAIKQEIKVPDNSRIMDKCSVLQTEAEAIEWIKHCTKPGITAFDIETTGIKPHRKEQKMLYASIATTEFSKGFRMYTSRAFLSAWVDYLLYDKVLKIAHNAKFEEVWNLIKYGVKTKGWYQDSMIAAHCLDNRSGITGLKFQMYVNFGFIGYDDVADIWITANRPGENPKSDNRLNMLEFADPDDTMMYCAMDSSGTLDLGIKQHASLRGHRAKGYKLFHESFPTYVDMETIGLRVDPEALITAEIKVTQKIDTILSAIATDPAVKGWEQKRKATFDHRKEEHLKDFLFKHLNQAPVVMTKGGKSGVQKPSVGKDALEAMYQVTKLEVLRQIIAYNKWSMIMSTYIEGIKREIVDYVIHCNLGLAHVKTYRTSCRSINLQNIPKRDPEVRDLLRAIFYPRKGNRFTEYDFKAFEVSIYACYSKDQALIDYVTDLTKDMHRDIAAYIFKTTADKIHKKVRQETKSGFVFAQLYGSNYTTNAQYFWDWFNTDAGQPFWKEFSERTGIRSYSMWEQWMSEVEQYFWYTLFPKLGAMKDAKWTNFLKTGKVSYFTGFYMTGNLKSTQVANGDVQGTASHLKLFVMNKANEKFIKDGAESRVFLEIHDSVLVDGPESEDAYVDSVFKWIVNTLLPIEYPWVLVPLYLEKSVSGVDRPWSELVEGEIINK